jgi:hypothetical protein
MIKLKDNDIVQVRQDVEANLITDNSRIEIKKGAVGTIVFVVGPADGPDAYMIEFYVKSIDDWALCTVTASDVEHA